MHIFLPVTISDLERHSTWRALGLRIREWPPVVSVNGEQEKPGDTEGASAIYCDP